MVLLLVLEKKTSYLWDGTYGLENVTEFSDAINLIKKEGDALIYDIKIPLNTIYKGGNKLPGMSIAFVNVSAEGEKEVIELGSGIFPKKDARKISI